MLFLIVSGWSWLPAFAHPTLGSVFSDHMVFQQNREIRIWGTADPRETISILFSTGVKSTAIADSSGHWQATLPPMHAGGPFDLTITGNQASVKLRDVLVGEVWLLSGQSNMTFELSRASNGEQALRKANRPQVRLLTIPKADSLTPQTNFAAQWVECSPDSARGFSAVGYFFGTALAEKLHVPIGLILSSWPGSQGEEWTPENELEHKPEFGQILSRWADAPDPELLAAKGGFPVSLELSDVELLLPDGTAEPLSQFRNGSIESRFGGAWSFSWKSASLMEWLLQPTENGAFTSVLRGRLRNQDTAALRLALKPGNEPADLGLYSGIRVRMRGSGYFKFQLNEPNVKDGSDYSSAVLQPKAEWQTVDLPFSTFKQPDWGLPEQWTPDAITGFQIVALTSESKYVSRPPAGLFNGMIAPLASFGVKGVLWYQGEGNVERAQQYRKLLPALIDGWRQAWNQPLLPFIVVQLPKYGPEQIEPGESARAELREAQAMAAQLPGVRLVVTTDLGEVNNLHPTDKVDVGNRAALVAESSVYGQNVTACGPDIKAIQVRGDSVIVKLAHVKGSLRSSDGEALRGFALAGEDRKFRSADAHIDGDTVVLHSDKVAQPVAVRYNWADSPNGNLTDDSRLPAPPFRSDRWAGITAGLQ